MTRRILHIPAPSSWQTKPARIPVTLFLPNQLSPRQAGQDHWVQLSPFGDFGNVKRQRPASSSASARKTPSTFATSSTPPSDASPSRSGCPSTLATRIIPASRASRAMKTPAPMAAARKCKSATTPPARGLLCSFARSRKSAPTPLRALGAWPLCPDALERRRRPAHRQRKLPRTQRQLGRNPRREWKTASRSSAPSG